METKKHYWECNNCGTNSQTQDCMIPCPRGGCEAKITGEIITTINKFTAEK